VVITLSRICYRGHSLFFTLKKTAARDLGWKRGDILSVVQFEDMLVLKRLPLGKIADEVAGSMNRRDRIEEKRQVFGEWDKKRNQLAPDK